MRASGGGSDLFHYLCLLTIATFFCPAVAVVGCVSDRPPPDTNKTRLHNINDFGEEDFVVRTPCPQRGTALLSSSLLFSSKSRLSIWTN